MLPHLFCTSTLRLWVCIVGFCGISCLVLFSFLSSRVLTLVAASRKVVSRDISCFLFVFQKCLKPGGLCGHLKNELDNHPMCLNCAFCCRLSPCEFCVLWPPTLLDRFEQQHSYNSKKMRKTKDTKKKPKKGFLSCFTRKEQGSAVASGKVDPPGETSCGLDDGSAHRSKSAIMGR